MTAGRGTREAVASLTADGTNAGDFDRTDWMLLISTVMIWGSSFLWISFALEGFHPGAIALIRTALGAGVLSLSSAARIAIPRRSWAPIAMIAIGGNAAPALLFPFAQQRVESSVAGMMNSASPVFVLVIALAMTRKSPPPLQLVGLAIGLVGAILMGLPNVTGADAEPLGIALVVLAIFGYATSNNIIPPLQQEYGGPAIIFWALTFSTVLLLPYGIYGLTQSSLEDPSSTWLMPIVAISILGAIGTGVARTVFATLVGRVGATRASMIGYFIPIVAVVLGVVIRDETVTIIELAGTGLVVVGARLISRGK